MKTPTGKNLIIHSSLALALALALSSPVQMRSAEPAMGMKMMQGKMMERCQVMMAQKEKLQADIKAQDSELTAQVAKMNDAPEGKQLRLMAAVITRMVEQQTALNARKARMDEAMMQHMLQHMQAGMESMSQCPMMKGMHDLKDMKDMKDMDDKSEGDHKEHHAEPK